MTNNVRADILIPGSTPLPCLKLAHKSLSGPLSPRERVRVRAPQRPGRFDHNRTKPNRSSLHRLRLDLPRPSKTNHSQPLFPRKTLGFRPIRPAEKKHLQPPSADSPKRSRRRSNHALAVEPRRTEPNTPEQLHQPKHALRPTRLVQNCPKLFKIVHPQSSIPSETLEILPVWPRRTIFSPNTRSPNNPPLPNTADQT